MKETKQTLLGMLSSLGLWIAGILLAGNIPAVADYWYFGGSAFVVAYPLLVGAVLIFAAYKCSSKGYKEFFLSFLLSYLIPIILLCILGIGALIITLVTVFVGENSLLIGVAVVLYFPLIILGAPALAVLTGLTGTLGTELIAYPYYIVFTLIGIIASAAVFRRKVKKQKISDTEN